MNFIKYCEGLGIVPNPLPNRIESTDVLSLNTFGLISANLYNFLPQMTYDKHKELFHSFRMNQWLHGIDANFFKGDFPLPVFGVDQLLEKIGVQNGIICTYHFGIYQLINSILVNSKISFALLVGEDVYNKWEERFPMLTAMLAGARDEGRFVLLNANKRASLRKMYDLTKLGFSIVIYVDGVQGLNKGAGTQLISVSFLGQNIFVPKGAASLSHYFNIPIYPVLALRRTNRIQIELGETIYPQQFVNREHYCSYAMTKIFSFLSSYVMHWPEQWTNWSLLHYFLQGILPLNREVVEAGNSLDSEYSLIKFQGNGFLLKKSDYKSYELHGDDFERIMIDWGL